MNKILLFALILLFSCNNRNSVEGERQSPIESDSIFILVLGTVQDAGSPHAGCTKNCCKNLFKSPDPTRLVTSLGLIDNVNKKTFIIEASPDLPRQMKYLKTYSIKEGETPDGVLLTHAHIGHYSGLMYLGKESMNAKGVDVFAMPRMESFLKSNGPWDQLVTTKNINLRGLIQDSTIVLTDQLSVTPFLVPHRDEYSETVGYLISGPNKKALFIPDIDKWQKWNRSILEMIKTVDIAYLDATFYDAEEINNRDIKQIPHPFVIESMDLFSSIDAFEKSKINFIHLNHTNPLLNKKSFQSDLVFKNGYNIASFLDKFSL